MKAGLRMADARLNELGRYQPMIFATLLILPCCKGAASDLTPTWRAWQGSGMAGLALIQITPATYHRLKEPCLQQTVAESVRGLSSSSVALYPHRLLHKFTCIDASSTFKSRFLLSASSTFLRTFNNHSSVAWARSFRIAQSLLRNQTHPILALLAHLSRRH